MSLKSLVATAEKRRRPIRETKPWHRRDYGWWDRLMHAEAAILTALKANPGRFKVTRDKKNYRTVIITVPALEYHGLTGWQHKRRNQRRPIVVRIPASVFKKRGLGYLLPKIPENGRGVKRPSHV